MWNLEQNAGAIAGFSVASAGPAVRQVEQDRYSLGYNFVAFLPTDIGYKANSAGIVLLRGMVQALRGRRCGHFLPTRRHGHVCCIYIIAACLTASKSIVLEYGRSPPKATGLSRLWLRNTLL
jgi:hypothetical protein